MARGRWDSRGGRLLQEGIVIILSILAALMLEGMRNDRESVRELERELASVGRELERNQERVVAQHEAVDRVMAGADALVEHLTEAEGAAFVEVLDTIAWLGTLWSPSLEPSLGALDALIASGRLAAIEDEALRVGLGELRDIFQDVSQEDVLAREITFDQLLEQVQGSELLTALRRVTTEFVLPAQRVGGSPQEASSSAIPSHGPVPYPNNAAIRSALSMKLVWYTAAKGELRSVETHLEDLINLVSLQLN